MGKIINLVHVTNDVKCDGEVLRDLKIDTLLHLPNGSLADYLTCDLSVLQQRNILFYDVLKVSGLEHILAETLEQLTHISKMISLKGTVGDNEQALYSVKQMQLYFDIIDGLNEFNSNAGTALRSAELIKLFECIGKIWSSAEYMALKEGTNKLLELISQVKSISVGFNFDSSFSPCEAGVLSINRTVIKSGKLVDRLLRMGEKEEEGQLLSMAPLIPTKKACREDEYNTLTYSLYAALSKVFRRQLRQWEPEINQYINEQLSFLLDLIPDLQFILNITRIHRLLQASGLHLCKAQYENKERKIFRAVGLYNPILALNLHEKKEPVIKNNFTFDENGMVYILTGPNNGGKTVFISAVCIAQIMAQIGMLVPADSLTVSPCEGIFVCFPKYHSLNEKGRLEEECARVAQMFRDTGEYSLCIFDEVFSSTDEQGAQVMTIEVLKALCWLGSRGIINTHLHGVAREGLFINDEPRCRSHIDTLSASVTNDGKRTYTIQRMPPAGKSYAETLSEKYGIDAEHLTKGRQKHGVG